MKFLYTALLILLIPFCTFSQWEYPFGDSITSEYGNMVTESHISGYLMVVGYESSNFNDITVVKVDATGNLVWQKDYDFGNSEDGKAIIKTSDGNYMVSAESSINRGYLLKINESGDTLWTKSYLGTSFYNITDIKETVGGQIALKIGDKIGLCTSSGDTLWTIQNSNAGPFIDVDPSGNIYAPINIYNGAYYNQGLFVTDINGNVLLNDTIDQGSTYSSYGIKVLSSGDCLTTGYANIQGEYDLFVTKFDINGDTLWTKLYGYPNTWELGYSITTTSNNAYVVIGSREFNIPLNNFDAWMLKLNSSGDSLWSRNYGGTDGDEGFWIESTTDGGFVFSGITRSIGNIDPNNNWYNAWMVKTDGAGYALLPELTIDKKILIKIVDLMGRETEDKPNTLLIHIYNDGTTEKVFRLE